MGAGNECPNERQPMKFIKSILEKQYTNCIDNGDTKTSARQWSLIYTLTVIGFELRHKIGRKNMKINLQERSDIDGFV